MRGLLPIRRIFYAGGIQETSPVAVNSFHAHMLVVRVLKNNDYPQKYGAGSMVLSV